MSATSCLILDTRRPKKTNKYPIKLRVISDRTPQYYQTIFDMRQEDWEKLSATRISEDLQKLRKTLNEIERTATNAIENFFPFDFQDFEKSFIAGHPHFKQRKARTLSLKTDLADQFDYSPFFKRFPILEEPVPKPCTLTWGYLNYIKQLLRRERIGSAVAYHCSYVSLKAFKGNSHLSSINVDYLIDYEKQAKKKGLSKATIGIYLRPLRAVFNEVIRQRLLDKDKHYPFGKGQYQIPTARKVKKALELTDVQMIYTYRCVNKTSSEQMAKDYWLFSYFGNGMNAKDIAHLLWENLDGDYITFERSKSDWAHRNDPVVITVYVNEDMKAIIERWGNKDRSPRNYIFPILQHDLTAMRVYDRVQDFVWFINHWMKEILLNLNIDKPATTYVARHTFSTVLKRSGVSKEFIQEALGHTNIATTERYLDSFEKSFKKEIATNLSAFKKNLPADEFFT